MPRATPESVARRAAILAIARSNPAMTYEAIREQVRMLGHEKPSRSTVFAVIKDHMPKLDPDWRKTNPHHRTYACQICGTAFVGETGYSGANAKRCPACRTRRAQ